MRLTFAAHELRRSFLLMVLWSALAATVSGCGQNGAIGGILDGSSVHICTASAFDSTAATCKHDIEDLSESGLATAKLAFTTGGNSTFSSTDTHFVVRRVNSDRTTIDVGSADSHDSSTSQYTNLSLNLAWVMRQAGAMPLRHAIYRIEVDNGGKSLGTADFTYHPTGPSVHVCAKPHFDKTHLVCLRDDHVLVAATFANAALVYSEGDGAPFSGTHTHYAISIMHSDGTSSTQGTFDTNDTSLANSVEAWTVSAVFVQANVSPVGGTTYSIEVDNNDHLLGVATFIYKANAGGL